ncbi:alpha/beta fold hydrolase [Variovorax sp. J22R115]|uniref:alpha/beta fold hydrolase n=1 Tax=Variovorax sp. J22R115 TaxID=3053509 RepID=UPI0025766782|nr:alpha/beta fold hydrolase [Variovorax sp. J22R115]MDM0050572.1 alpha/beta fold hydrolase [Variovorax sp. J22R115]
MKALSKLWPVVFGLALCVAGQSYAHWEDQPPHQMARLGELKLEGGGVIPNLKMTYVTHGKLNAAKDNAILFLHGFGANHHGMDHHIGPGRALDTNKFFIICSDALGATQFTYEHSTSPTNSGLKMAFPQYGGRDMVNAQYKLVTEGLGISHLLAVTGISSGAMYSTQFAVSYPDFIDGIIPLVGGSFNTSTGSFRWPLMVSMMESCVGWNGGNYDENPAACATQALSVQTLYFYSPAWWDQHVDTPEAYQRWRVTLGAYYLDIQDARDLYYMYKSFYNSWLGDTPGFNGNIEAALASIKAKALYIYSSSDQIFSPKSIEAEVALIPKARALAIDSIAGHTIWWDADPQATVTMSRAIKAFLSELTASKTAGR